MRSAVVTGAGGFIGTHLVRRLKAEGYVVRGVDRHEPEFAPTAADEFLLLDLTRAEDCRTAVRDLGGSKPGEVYQLAANMGGMGYIHNAEVEILHKSTLINLNMIDAAARADVSTYFLASSVCVYRDMSAAEAELPEETAYPANPDNEYGWEKLYAERVVQAYGRRFDLVPKIARFQNCYGPETTWTGGREKAPAAICRKVAEAPDHGTIEVWGDGTAIRNYTYIADLIDGIRSLATSDDSGPMNIGSDEYVTVDELVHAIIAASGKDLSIVHVDGPVGVHARNFSNKKLKALGWSPKVTFSEGVAQMYAWVDQQVHPLC